MEKWNVISILKVTEEYFSKKGIETPRLDAEVLLAHLLGMSRVELYLNFDRPLSEEEVNSYRELVRRRGRREPVAYITGHREFYGHDFIVTRDVLIPRPETETLVDVAKDLIKNYIEAGTPPRVLELGTGSGAVVITLALEFPEVEFRATDVKENILRVARENAEKHGVKNVEFKISNLCGACRENFFDIIIFNPPYISRDEFRNLQPELKYEPEIALIAPEGGNYFYRRILEDGKRYLRERGYLVLEIGTRKQKIYVHDLAEKEGWRNTQFFDDLSGLPRVALVEK